MYGNPIEIPVIRKNQFRVLRSQKLGENCQLWSFCEDSKPCASFHLGTLHGYFFHWDFWPNLNFLLEHQIKLVLNFWIIVF